MRVLRPLALVVVSLLFPLGGEAGAAERPLRVVGSASLQAQVARTAEGKLRLEGKLLDDAGAGVARGAVRMTLPPGSSHRAHVCGSEEVLPLRGGPTLETNEHGAFCAELDAGLFGSQVTLAFDDEAGLLGATELQVDLSPAPRRLELRLTTASELPLDTPVHTIEVAVVPRRTSTLPREESGLAPPAPLPIHLALEAPHREPRQLGRVPVHVGERGRLEVPADALGPPGTAVLVARFDGNETWAPAEARHHVSKTAFVALGIAPKASLVDVTSPVELPVEARCARGSVQSGSIEAFAGAERLGVAPLSEGSARLTLTIPEKLRARAEVDDSGRQRLQVTLAYVPNAPWWKAGTPTTVELTLAEPSAWAKLSWALAALVVLIWVVLIWRRPVRRPQLRSAQPADPPGTEHLVVVESGGKGWSGQVFDAHTAAPIGGATLNVLVPGVHERKILAAATTDAAGSFAFLSVPERQAESGAPLQLQVTANGYSVFERPLPRRGHFAIHVVTLRRALVDRLLQWAHRKGPPWQGRVLPTPEHIAQTAETRREAETARWARRVEAAAFGPEPPDEALHRELHDAEPP